MKMVQGRREPNVGRGPAEICRITDFVNRSFVQIMMWSPKKKKVFTEILTVFFFGQN